jgi:AbrB family looped-hinge helix DNA binding protein
MHWCGTATAITWSDRVKQKIMYLAFIPANAILNVRNSYIGGESMSIDVLTVSSKGQIVLPAEMRKRLSIGSGAKLAAYASDDVIMLKLITIPTERDFSERLDEAREWAASVGYQESDVNDIIKEVRRKKRL